jgi:CHAT domain-containing protein/Tfp pilus assembly protein PilF
VANRSTVDGAYTLELTALHPASARELEGVRAHEAWRRAVSLALKDTPEALRAARDAYEEAARRFDASGENLQQARALLRMGRMQYLLHDRTAALATYERALPLYREANDLRGEAALLINIGSVHQAMAEPTLALQRFERAAAVFRADGDAYRTATALHNLGWVHHSLGEFKEAGSYYREALALWPTAGNKIGEAQTTHSLGMLYFDLGQPVRSREYFESALAMRRAIGDRPGEAQTLVHLGAVFAARNDRGRAREAFGAALAAARVAEDKVEEAAALLGLAAMDDNGGDSALHILEALAIARAVKDRRREAIALQRLGDWRLGRGESASALTHYMAALTLQRAAGDPRGEAESLLALARLEREAGALAKARHWAGEAVLKVESVRGRVVQPDLRASYFATAQSYYDAYIDASMRLHAQDPDAGYDVAALQASERARARSLLDRLIEQQADLLADVDASLIERERGRRRALNAKDLKWRTLIAESAEEAQVRAARLELDRALDALREVEGELRAHSPRYAELTQREPVSLEGLRADLGDDSALLEYWLGEERSYLWVITDERSSSHVLPRGADLETLAREYFAAVSARRPEVREASIARTGSALSRALLPSAAADHVRDRRLVVVSHGALEYLPFGALPDMGAAEEPLLRTREVVNLPSASVLHALRAYRSRQPPAKTIAVFGDPVFSRDDPRLSRVSGAHAQTSASEDELQRSAADAGLGRLRRLRFSRIEANAISALAPASTRFAALDFEASRAAALSPALAEYRIVHFATHGLINSVHPELSGLAFSAFDERGAAQDSLVRLHDIYGMSLQADLVVLSACRTALGPAVKGEGLVGLTRGFMYAGAPRVLATLWSVEDAATAHAMTQFYKELLVNERKPADALRRAQLAMLDDPRWSAPYYWGGFVLQGDWR